MNIDPKGALQYLHYLYLYFPVPEFTYLSTHLNRNRPSPYHNILAVFP